MQERRFCANRSASTGKKKESPATASTVGGASTFKSAGGHWRLPIQLFRLKEVAGSARIPILSASTLALIALLVALVALTLIVGVIRLSGLTALLSALTRLAALLVLASARLFLLAAGALARLLAAVVTLVLLALSGLTLLTRPVRVISHLLSSWSWFSAPWAEQQVGQLVPWNENPVLHIAQGLMQARRSP